MARVSGKKEKINSAAVFDFFEQRAAKFDQLGSLRTVIYQDKHPNLPERRDHAEKKLLFPKLQLGGEDFVLDVGCGIGRWAEMLIPNCARYHGTDISPGLIEIAKRLHGHHPQARFSVCAADQLSLEHLGEAQLFTRLACFGVLIYLNDDEAERALQAMASCAAKHCIFVLREPVGINARLTILEHFSEDMDQTYNAIYRTELELMTMIDRTCLKSGFKIMESGDVYADAELNNRTDTRQRFYVLAR